ncbi:hypothetical protein [Defluviicoccus vanus]|uniref:Uncharacterized protein n=1 Tax=Defluviicoccus vanus TaxID=111831 RepID=A0A7H1N331_9PROT|nr:hypothetical protein [Defluviicoccus vanus]QNT70117.1 hypothetical protein HQ394_13240 [Defluviicoccus vanus]
MDASDWLAGYNQPGHQHKFMWPVRPHNNHTRNGWLDESNGWRRLVTQFMAAINGNRPGDGMYMITSDDYLEGAEIMPSDRSQHAIYDVCGYYIHWFRSGVKPPIVRDCIYYMHRMHDYNAAPNQSYQTVVSTVGPGIVPLGGGRFAYRSTGGTPDNKISVLCFFTEDVDDVMAITFDGTRHSGAVAGGTPIIVEFDLPTTTGGNIRFQVKRGGAVIIDMPSAFKYYVLLPGHTLPYWQDPLPAAGGSLRYELGQQGLIAAPYAEPILNCRTHIKGTLGMGPPAGWTIPGWPPPGGALPDPS